MKDKKFFYEQYNHIDWSQQEKTKMNSYVNDYIIDFIIKNINKDTISIFDIGFGIGFFIKAFIEKVKHKYKSIFIEGCEPSNSYHYFVKNKKTDVDVVSHFLPFLDVNTENKFNVITAIYVFPHIQFNELESFIQKIYSMLNENGRFICIITSEKSFKTDRKNDKDLFNVVEQNNVEYDGKKYDEILHKSMLPEIGYVYDYNRDEDLYVDMFLNNNFEIEERKELNDGYFLHSLLIFKKK